MIRNYNNKMIVAKETKQGIDEPFVKARALIIKDLDELFNIKRPEHDEVKGS